jgi:hypothetical protein
MFLLHDDRTSTADNNTIGKNDNSNMMNNNNSNNSTNNKKKLGVPKPRYAAVRTLYNWITKDHALVLYTYQTFCEGHNFYTLQLFTIFLNFF